MRQLVALVFFLILTRPITDMFWQFRVGVGSLATSPQGWLGLLFILLALPVAMQQVSRGRGAQRIVAALFLVFFTLVAMGFAIHGGQMDFILKYVSSLSAFVVVPWAFAHPRPWRHGLAAAVVVAVVGSAFLQLFGVLPYHVFDNIHVYDPSSHNNIMQVGRLSGAYYHPLDLMRVLIWVWFALLLGLVRGPVRAAILAAVPAAALFTTHRVTMIVILLSAAVASMSRPRSRGLMALILCVAIWAFSGVGYKAVTGKPILSTMIPSEFLTSTNEDPVPAQGEFVAKPSVRLQLVESNNVRFANGRGTFWAAHWGWLRTFAPLELAFGTGRRPIPLREWEPHNQAIDAMERFGILGILILAAFFLAAIRSAPASLLAKVLAVVALALYGAMTEILVMPTFSLMAAAFLWWEPRRGGNGGG